MIATQMPTAQNRRKRLTVYGKAIPIWFVLGVLLILLMVHCILTIMRTPKLDFTVSQFEVKLFRNYSEPCEHCSYKNKIVILSTQRSGTHWLASMLRSNTALRLRWELFSVGDLQNYADRYGLKSIDNLTLSHAIEVVNEEVFFSGYYGFILHYNQHLKFPGLLAYLKKAGFKVIILTRSNVFNTMLSLELERTADQAMCFGDCKARDIKVTFPPDTLLSRLHGFELLNENIKTVAAEHNFTRIAVTYEELISGKEDLCRLFHFFGCSCPENKHSQLSKIVKGNKSQFIANYDEVVATLRKTKYKRMLEEP